MATRTATNNATYLLVPFVSSCIKTTAEEVKQIKTLVNVTSRSTGTTANNLDNEVRRGNIRLCEQNVRECHEHCANVWKYCLGY